MKVRAVLWISLISNVGFVFPSESTALKVYELAPPLHFALFHNSGKYSELGVMGTIGSSPVESIETDSTEETTDSAMLP